MMPSDNSAKGWQYGIRTTPTFVLYGSRRRWWVSIFSYRDLVFPQLAVYSNLMQRELIRVESGLEIIYMSFDSSNFAVW